MTLRGTSGTDDPAANPYATINGNWRIVSVVYDGSSRIQWGNGRQEYSIGDSGVIPATAFQGHYRWTGQQRR